jgi:Cu(I)/Ag(I) efflux system membrane fusion protein
MAVGIALSRRNTTIFNQPGTVPEVQLPAGPRPARQRLRGALALLQVRLRLPIVLILAAIVVGQWDLIRNYWGRLTRVTQAESIARQAVSGDTEYFCPMDPGVISDWPSKCGVCNMALVRRKRGEALSLPDGVLARMQLSPNRVQLAGIQTAPATFRALEREYECAGLVSSDQGAEVLIVLIPASQAPWVARGQEVSLEFPDLPGRQPAAGRIRAVTAETAGGWKHLRTTIVLNVSPGESRDGMAVVARFKAPVRGMEPFRSMPQDPPPLGASEPRRVYICLDHPATIALAPGACPIDDNARAARALLEHQRVRFWCPMHPAITADHPGEHCAACGGMALEPRILSFQPAGKVLSIPRSAVIDGGAKKVVFVESMPGMFDGVEVEVGPRCGEFYPVVQGVEAGQRVAVAGAFLLDAETRLNPSLASAYFGAGRAEHHGASPAHATARAAPEPADALAGLSPEDRALAQRQKLCPVTGKPLGSMGTPARANARGTPVFLCCDGCKGALARDPEKYLAKLPKP